MLYRNVIYIMIYFQLYLCVFRNEQNRRYYIIFYRNKNCMLYVVYQFHYVFRRSHLKKTLDATHVYCVHLPSTGVYMFVRISKRQTRPTFRRAYYCLWCQLQNRQSIVLYRTPFAPEFIR